MVPAASRLTVMVLSRLSPKTVSAPALKKAETVGVMRSASGSSLGRNPRSRGDWRPVGETGPDFFRERRSQESDMRRYLQGRKHEDRRPRRGRDNPRVRGANRGRIDFKGR